MNVSLAYTYSAFSFIYQHLYTGEVFITDDNLTGRLFSLKAYDIANIMVSYKVLQTSKQALDVLLSVNNVYNEIYQNVASRPMPNRNFNIQLNYKF
jgi:iron complex outermembrane receptor protein